MKHKVGDTVTIRKDLNANVRYGIDTLVDEMVEFIGYTTEIVEVNDDEKFYSLAVDNEKWNWTDEMLESV